jgi:hypothetical protein
MSTGLRRRATCFESAATGDRMAKVSAADRKPLTPGRVQTIVVANTPDHPKDPAPQTMLKSLGIVDDESAETHKEGIRSDLKSLGWRISPGDIDSAPATTIAACRNSVLNNAW